MAGDDGRAQVQLDEDTLARRRRVLGEDHPDTLTSAFILAAELTELGEYQAAKELNEDILDRRRRVLGDDHPDTMASASFALILSGLAADPKARALVETMKAARSQPGEGGSQTADLNSQTGPAPDSAQSRHRRRAPRQAIGALTATVTATAPANGKRQRSAAHTNTRTSHGDLGIRPA